MLTAGTADEALVLVEAQRPDVLVSDIGMPDADGFELLRRVRALGPERGGRVPAIALTAFARSEDRTRALRAGFLVHVSKPVDPSELVATVASVAKRVNRTVIPSPALPASRASARPVPSFAGPSSARSRSFRAPSSSRLPRHSLSLVAFPRQATAGLLLTN